MSANANANANANQSSSSSSNLKKTANAKLLLQNMANQLEIHYTELKADPTHPIKLFSLEGLPTDLEKRWTQYHLFGQMYKQLVTRTQGAEISGATQTGYLYYSYIQANYPKCAWFTDDMKKYLEEAHQRAGPRRSGGGSRSNHCFKRGYYVGMRVLNTIVESAVSYHSDELAELDPSYSVLKNKGKKNESGENSKSNIINDILKKFGSDLENNKDCVDAVAELNRVWIIGHDLGMNRGKKDPELIEANANIKNAKIEVGRVAFEVLRPLINLANATQPVTQNASSGRTNRRRGTRRRTSNDPNEAVDHNGFEVSVSASSAATSDDGMAGLGRRPRRTTTLPMTSVGA